MTDEPTADIAQKYDASPTIETLLTELRAFRAETAQRFDGLEQKLERIEIRLDRVESMALETRADMRELKGQLKEHFPFVK